MSKKIIKLCTVCDEAVLTSVTCGKMVCDCEHDDKICFECHCQWIENSNEFINGIKCLVKDCKNVYRLDFITFMLSNDKAKAIIGKIEEATFFAQPNTMYCSKPTCSKWLKFEDKNDGVRTVVCECGNEMCADCQSEPHEGLTCEMYALEVAEAQAAGTMTSQQLVDKITKRCPECQFRVWKLGGCPHINCQKCGYEFCFGCLEDYTGYRGDHSGCMEKSVAFETQANRLFSDMQRKHKAKARADRRAFHENRREEIRLKREAEKASMMNDEDDGYLLSLFLNDELYAIRGRNNGWVEIDGEMLSQLLNSEVAEEEEEAHDDKAAEVVTMDKLIGQEGYMLSLLLNDELEAMHERNNGEAEKEEATEEVHDDNEVEVVTVNKRLGQEERVDIVLDRLLGKKSVELPRRFLSMSR